MATRHASAEPHAMTKLEQTETTAKTVWQRFAKPNSVEHWLYLLTVGALTLVAAHGFFESRDLQLAWAEASRSSLDPNHPVRQLPRVWWSAPLDDTFIHFDFARSFARLHPFEWTPNGGYSSGATSWLYPMLLGVGVLLGFDGQHLGTFADLVACCSLFGFFWAARSLFTGLPRFTSYLLPVFVLSSGVLGWAIWSGMELGLFFGIWGVLAHYYVKYRTSASAAERAFALQGMSVSSLLLVMTRPEALVCCGLFALFACFDDSTRGQQPLRNLIAIGSPALAFTVLRALINLVYTGSLADAGALVKLVTLRPFLEPREMALRWAENVGFQFYRITIYHTTDDEWWGWQVWLLLALALVSKFTRRTVVLLVSQALCWIVLVSQNEYVRYQNDRYTMPAVLWLLVAIAVGLAGTLNDARQRLGERTWHLPVARSMLATLLAGSFLFHQLPRLKQQWWLFGRACRNIAEQQVRVGQLLGAGLFGPTQRVLVGDAGAIPFFSELRGLDAIGLGGTQGLPFAKAVNLGIGATVELVERMPPHERPDRMALYPSWWELLPVWFGRRLDEVRIHGNVICGASSKVIYDAEWRGLDNAAPFSAALGTHIIDELDFADVLSEAEHEFRIDSAHSGYVVTRVLPDPRRVREDLFDAGRLVFADAKTRFVLSGLSRGQPATLIFRAAPVDRMAFSVKLDGRNAGRVEFEGGDDWQEAFLDLDAAHLRKHVWIELAAETSEYILYHLWAVPRQPRVSEPAASEATQ